MGMMPLTLGQFWQEQADTKGCMGSWIDAFRGCVTVDKFLVTWRWQTTPLVHRYPSPIGRLGHTPCQAPELFSSFPKCYDQRQGLAQTGARSPRGWNQVPIRGVTARECTIRKGAEIWESASSNRQQSSRSPRCWGSRPAAIRWANRHCWAAQPGPAHRSPPAVIPQPAPPSARRATSPIARPIRNAADAPARITVSFDATVGALGLGGLFYAMAADRAFGQDMTKRKGQTCSTRS